MLMGKRRYITFKVDLNFTAEAALLPLTRAPPMLTSMESATLLLLLLLLLLPQHQPGQDIFSFTNGLEDLVVFSSVRTAAICVTYVVGSQRYNLSPYLYTSYAGGFAGLLYVLVKGRVFHFDPVRWPPAAAMMVTFGVFSWLHILAARRAVVWARRRGQLGLAPITAQGPFRCHDEAGLLPAPNSNRGADWRRGSDMDLPAALLTDADSQFINVDGLLVHYKEAWPDGQAAGDCAVVLVHGFGGGVFAWRHILQPLAAAVGARVVAFDRPGFGGSHASRHTEVNDQLSGFGGSKFSGQAADKASPAQLMAGSGGAAGCVNVTTSKRASSCGSDAESAAVHVEGMALLHPNLSGHQVSAFTRLLVGSSLGRSMMRPLLRSEVGEAISRRAWWYNPDLITAELLALYKQPLRVQGWDTALVAASRATGSVSHKKVAAQLAVLRQLPTLLVTGQCDKIVTVDKLAALSALLRRSRRVVVPACGHLSHEETPAQLLEALVPFCKRRLENC
eukprot:gene13357-13485_t